MRVQVYILNKFDMNPTFVIYAKLSQMNGCGQ
jgi:hypothetical protein